MKYYYILNLFGSYLFLLFIFSFIFWVIIFTISLMHDYIVNLRELIKKYKYLIDINIYAFNKPTYMEHMDDLAMIAGSKLKVYVF